MNTDTELFELCKQVYEKTGWKDTLEFFHEGETYVEGEYMDYGMSYNFTENTNDFPIYTSDYLLEKLLPNHLTITNHWASGGWKAQYQRDGDMYNEKGSGHMVTARTPLKALLKLTLALIESGELKGVKS